MALVAFAIALALIVASVRVVPESERMAVHSLGRFLRLKGPGIHFRLPGSGDVWSRLALGMRGELLAAKLGRFGSAVVPISSAESLQPGQFIRISGFLTYSAQVSADAVQMRTVRCAQCGHENALA